MVELAKLFMKRFRYLPHHVDLLYHLSYNGYKWRQANNSVHSYTRSVIQKRKDALAHPEVKSDERKYVDFLDILLSAKVRLCIPYWKDQMRCGVCAVML